MAEASLADAPAPELRQAAAEPYPTLAAFWPFYLEEHRHPVNRTLHVLGTSLAVVWLVLAVVLQAWWFALLALVNGYAFAWIGHFGFEHNRPATFQYPLKSFLSDWKLLWYTLTGRIGKEYRRLGLK